MKVLKDPYRDVYIHPRKEFLFTIERELLYRLREKCSDQSRLNIYTRHRVKDQSSAVKKNYGSRDVFHDLLGLRIVSPHPGLFDCIEEAIIQVAAETGFLLSVREDLYTSGKRFGHRAIHHDYVPSEEVGLRLHPQAGLEVQITSYAWSIVGDVAHQKVYKRSDTTEKEVELIRRLEVAAIEMDEVLLQLFED